MDRHFPCVFQNETRRYSHSKGPWRIISPYPTVYQRSPWMICQWPPIHQKELRGKLRLHDSLYSAPSIKVGCRRVKTRARET